MKQKNTANNGRFHAFDMRSLVVFFCFLIVWTVSKAGKAEDWVTYRSDIARSGVILETVGPELYLQWKYIPRHSPKPAWPMPAEETPRMHVDNALNVAAADGRVYFGSAVTNKVYALDAVSGKIRWSFFTEGPVRFAPTYNNGRIYFGSDDGRVYCLNARTGSLIWKYRAGPSDEKVIGNGRMISLWPVRTSVLVDNEVVYFTAGIFPYEGIYICALNTSDGSVIWKNDTISDRVYELEFGGISPHGYLVASKEVLYVPSGRAMPAGFDRRTGKFLFYASPGSHRGGVWALLDNDRLIAGVVFSQSQGMKEVPIKIAYDAKTGKRRGDAFAWFPGIDMVITRDVSYVLTREGIYAINRVAYSQALKKVAASVKKRKSLAKELENLRKKQKTEEKSRKSIKRRVEDIIRSISILDAEEKRIKDSSFMWHYAGRGFASLIYGR